MLWCWALFGRWSVACKWASFVAVDASDPEAPQALTVPWRPRTADSNGEGPDTGHHSRNCVSRVCWALVEVQPGAVRGWHPLTLNLKHTALEWS